VPEEGGRPAEKSKDPAAGRTKEGLPSEDGKRKLRINEEGKCEVCASPCDVIRRKYASVMTPELEARIKLIEDNPALSDPQKEAALKPIEQELADLVKATAPPAPREVIRLESPERIEATQPVQNGDIVNWRLFDKQSKAEFSDVDVDVSNPADPKAPDQLLTPKDATLPDGTKVKLEADFPFTDESLKKNRQVWEEHFKKPLTDYSGSLAEENLGNFQAEFSDIRAKNPSLSAQEVGDLAIRKVSFGKGRIRIGFDKLSVTLDAFADLVIEKGPHKGEAVKNVPQSVIVSAQETPK
jgi:hypothetical protein